MGKGRLPKKSPRATSTSENTTTAAMDGTGNWMS